MGSDHRAGPGFTPGSLARLTRAYPGWCVFYVSPAPGGPGGYIARRPRHLSDAERDLGLRTEVRAPTEYEMAAGLAYQSAITQGLDPQTVQELCAHPGNPQVNAAVADLVRGCEALLHGLSDP